MKKVLITDNLHERLAQRLQKMGYECIIEPGIDNLQLANCIGEYHGIVIATKIKVTAELLSKANNLEFVARAGSGMENIDRQATAIRGIQCVNSPEGNKDAVAEHALGSLLNLLNNGIQADREVKTGIWKREANRGIELMGKTVGIIGYGHTGSAFARRLMGFGVRILAYDKYRRGYADEWVEECDLRTIYKGTDILSLHLPLSNDTKKLLDRKMIDDFEKPIYLLNTSRGSVVDMKALIGALESGKILGAALDVLPTEPPATNGHHPPDWFEILTGFDNVVLSPHVAGWTVQSKLRIAEVLAGRIELLGLHK